MAVSKLARDSFIVNIQVNIHVRWRSGCQCHHNDRVTNDAIRPTLWYQCMHYVPICAIYNIGYELI